jgi:hypothetical protein
MPPDDLAALFPELAGQLPSGTPTTDPGPDLDPELSEAGQALIAQRLSRTSFAPGGNGTPPTGGVEDEVTTPPVGEQVPVPVPDADGDDDDEDDDEENDDEKVEAPGTETPATPPPASDEPPPDAGDAIDVPGLGRIPTQWIKDYRRFEELLAARPDAARELQRLFFGSPQQQGVIGGAPAPASANPPAVSPALTPAALTPPADLDLDDPNVRALWDAHVQTQTQLHAMRAGLQQTAAQQAAQALAQSEAIVNRASTLFATRHELTPDESHQVQEAAAKLNIIPQRMRAGARLNPGTGQWESPDLFKVVDEVLEMAFYGIPEFREREVERTRVRQIKATKRKNRAGALAGSSGSVPRSQQAPRPGTPASRAAMTAEVDAMMNGTWQGDNA